MACPPFAARERLVRDVPDEVLEETVLAVLGRARVGLEREHLLADEPCEEGAEVSAPASAEGRQPSLGERLAEHGAVLEQPPLVRREAVEPRGDQGMQRLGDVERGDLARGPVDGAVLDEIAAVEEHAHGLDGVERHALGAGEDLLARLRGEAGDEAVEEVAHRLLRERIEVDAREVALTGSPGRPPLDQLGPGERDDVEGVVARPVEQVLDEVEQARVGRLHVLEGEYRRIHLREPLEEEPPGGEQVLPVGALRLAESEQLREARLDECALALVRQMLLERLTELCARGVLVVVLGDAAAHPHHVRERPVRDPVPVGEARPRCQYVSCGSPSKYL